MTHLNRRFANGFLSSIALLLASGVATLSTATVTPFQDSTQDWSQRIWDSAKNSEFPGLDQLRVRFDAMPDGSFDQIALEHFRQTDTRNRENERKAFVTRDEAHNEALKELLEEKSNENLSQALLAAVKAQTFSENFNDAFENSMIMEIVAQAEREIPELEANGEWLEAQELIYRLRTLYSDTDFLEKYDLYDKQLMRVSRRVSMLSKYAPRHMHDYRSRRAERLGEEPLDEFNEARADDWQERLRDINIKMLKRSMKTAAVEHIENERWLPLLEGGLESLSLLASTPALSETFPALDDKAMVRKWIGFIDKELQTLDRQNGDDMTSWTLSRLLSRILETNEKTLNFPPELIYREFGDGAMYKLDRFSEIMWPNKLRRFEQATQGNFVGVGIIIRETETNDILVVNPTEGGPAYYAGVKPNDLIKEVNRESTAGWSVNDAVDNITGKVNTDVELG
ncbi:MAG: PDZ domain-containing protein, partial [Planctomycetota bacterium]|nr:PDZ domain-containing protein [Planctomycetota bacterium]